MKNSHPEEVDKALLIFRQQLSCHANVQEDEFGRGLDVEVIGDAPPQAIRVSHPDKDVARV